MTETKLYFKEEDRKRLLKFYQTISVDGDGREQEMHYNAKDVRNDVIKLLVDTTTLLTTIESQKEEITKWKTSKESWEKETLFANGEIRKRDIEIVQLTKRMKDYEKQAVENMVRFENSQDVVEHLNIQIESLKAITELAVKGLEEITLYSQGTALRFVQDMKRIADTTLSEIAKLSHE